MKTVELGEVGGHEVDYKLKILSRTGDHRYEVNAKPVLAGKSTFIEKKETDLKQ